MSQLRSSGNGNHIGNWFGSAVVVQNVIGNYLNNTALQCDLRDVPIETFIISDNKWKDLTFELSVHAARCLCEFHPWLSVFPR